MTTKPVIILFRDAHDGYRQALEDAGFRVQFVPVLAFEAVSPPCLPHGVPVGASMAVTSRRALHVLAAQPELLAAVRRISDRIYAVGPATAAAAHTLGFHVVDALPGDAAGLADVLAESGATHVLHLTGEPHREELAAGLAAHGIPLSAAVLYHARPAPPAPLEESPAWAAFFSPRGVATVVEAGVLDRTQVRYAAIGPTTAEALRAAGLDPAAVAAEPEASALARAVAGFATKSQPHTLAHDHRSPDPARA